ncbi:MAG: hypothetical protein ACE5D7_05935 [Fidelibacterota bacterium]
MVFQADTAFALELIALGLGFWILLKTRSTETANLKGFGSFIGYFIIVAAFLALLCTSYYSVKYWEDGHFSQPNQSRSMMTGSMHKMQGYNHGMTFGKMGMGGNSCDQMMGSQTCGNMMDQCKMMNGKMGGKMDSQCKMMKDGKGKMMGDQSEMKDHKDHHPDMKDEG